MLSPSARRLIWINGLFALANGLSGLFTNVYLWRLKPGVTTPAFFNLFQMITIMIVMPAMGAVVKRKGAVPINVAAMTLYSGFYLTLLVLQEQAANYLAFLGIFLGAALGCYALATHTLAYDLTDGSNREAYYNRNGLFTAGAGLLAPLVAGWTVSSFPGLAGYRLIFIISAIFFATAAVMGLSLHALRPTPSPYRLRSVLPGAHPGWRRQLGGYFIMGMRDGVFSFSVSLLVFLATGGERSLGNFAFVTSVVGLASFWVAGRYMTPANRSRLFPLGAVLMGLATAVVALGATWQVMLLHGLLNALSTPLWQTAWNALGFDVIRQASGHQDLRVEMIGAREIPLNLGRITSLLLVLNFAPTSGAGGVTFLRLLLALLGLVFPVTWALVRKSSRGAGAPDRATA